MEVLELGAPETAPPPWRNWKKRPALGLEITVVQIRHSWKFWGPFHGGLGQFMEVWIHGGFGAVGALNSAPPWTGTHSIAPGI